MSLAHRWAGVYLKKGEPFQVVTPQTEQSHELPHRSRSATPTPTTARIRARTCIQQLKTAALMRTSGVSLGKIPLFCRRRPDNMLKFSHCQEKSYTKKSGARSQE
jgi:hypothetical protein